MFWTNLNRHTTAVSSVWFPVVQWLCGSRYYGILRLRWRDTVTCQRLPGFFRDGEREGWTYTYINHKPIGSYRNILTCGKKLWKTCEMMWNAIFQTYLSNWIHTGFRGSSPTGWVLWNMAGISSIYRWIFPSFFNMINMAIRNFGKTTAPMIIPKIHNGWPRYFRRCLSILPVVGIQWVDPMSVIRPDWLVPALEPALVILNLVG